MKKISFGVIFALFPSFAFAATISLSPASGTWTVGQTHTVSVYVTPDAGEKIYTAKAVLTLSDIEAQNFIFANGWLPLTQPGYDALTPSSVTKTAGYPGGIGSATLLGTLTVAASAAGQGGITIGSDSQTLNSANANSFTSTGSATFTINPPAAAPTKIVNSAAPTTKTTSPTRSLAVATKTPAAQTASTTAAAASTTNTAAPTAPTETAAVTQSSAPVQQPPLTELVLVDIFIFAAGLGLGWYAKTLRP